MQGGRDHWTVYYTSPQSQHWGLLLNLLVHLFKCSNILTNNCNIQKCIIIGMYINLSAIVLSLRELLKLIRWVKNLKNIHENIVILLSANEMFQSIYASDCQTQGKPQKTMTEKFVYIHNDDTQKYPLMQITISG